ncbi:MAG: beta-glucosidase [Bifidobacteriaceae bacterium]|jgi:beta-glucosidase|nr:beta-glucosidase [Bifidobacteriaceae bacterium]
MSAQFDPRAFPKGFTWGVATAAYQIEGAVCQDGRGQSIWDTFSHTPGKVAGGETGDVTCDHYHRWREDLDIMADLGIDAYRLSTAWSRIQPTGKGQPNPAGVNFYSRLVDGLLERGIKPVVTLYHWDLPQALEDSGGWLNRDTPKRFSDYAALMSRTLGDRVDLWITLNEPWCAAFLGYAEGIHAPGLTSPAGSIAAAHHLNLAHGLAIEAIRGTLGSAAKVSVALNPHVVHPASESPEDAEAVRRITTVGDEIFYGPLLDGRYSSQLVADLASVTDWSFVHDADLARIHQPLNCLGVNYYSTMTVAAAEPEATAPGKAAKSVKAGKGGKAGKARRRTAGERAKPSPWVGAEDVRILEPTGPLTAMGWNIKPDGLTELLTGLSARYPSLPLMVTENGSAFPDKLVDGKVADPKRIDYLERHLAAVGAAIQAGAKVEGYFAWSLMDNFEWACGYSKRFGLVYVDYPDCQRRYLKDSAHRYREIIAATS